jgi:predicted ester cyclase
MTQSLVQQSTMEGTQMPLNLGSALRIATLSAALTVGAAVPAAWSESTFTAETAAVNIEVAKRFYTLLNGGDPVEWRAVFADGWTAWPPLAAEGPAVDGYENVIGAFRAGFPDFKAEQVEVIANENVVAVRSLITGTNTAPLFGQEPTGKKIAFTAIDIHRIENGKIAETWHVEDFVTMRAQLAGN